MNADETSVLDSMRAEDRAKLVRFAKARTKVAQLESSLRSAERDVERYSSELLTSKKELAEAHKKAFEVLE